MHGMVAKVPREKYSAYHNEEKDNKKVEKVNVQKVEKCINKIHTRRSTKTHTTEGKHTSRKSSTPQYLIHERKDRCAPNKTIGKTQR